MKINATIVKEEGLCYGMVMPEKPYYGCKKFNKTECPCSIEHMCHCAIIKRDYDNALQSAKDAAVRYEDQNKANELTWNSHPESDLYGKGLENFKKSCYKFKEGEVYPLPEPLVVIEIWQYQVKGYPNWNNCVRGEIEPLYKNSKFNYRTFLRISQGTDNKSLDPELSSIKARNKVFAGFGSEGGEPTRKVIAGCRYSKCDCASGDECFEYEKVGVEEKKEHETAKTYSYLKSPDGTLRISDPNGWLYCMYPYHMEDVVKKHVAQLNGGVSEGEPNQEHENTLWLELARNVKTIDGDESFGNWLQRQRNKFTISRKLKP